jgi:hypothetical protein
MPMILIEYARQITCAQQRFAHPDETTRAFLQSLGATWYLSSKLLSSKAQDMYYLDDTLESVRQSIANGFSDIRAFGDAGDITNVEVIQPFPRSQIDGSNDDIRYCYNYSEC